MNKYLINLTLVGVAMSCAPAMAIDFRFPAFQEEPLCGDGPPLQLEDQHGLVAVSGATYLAHYRLDGAIKELMFKIETPRAFKGDDFPADICGSTVVLTMDGGPEIRGVMEYLPPIPGDEHKPWPYAIKLDWDEKREMRFSGSYSTAVWGAVEVPVEGGGFDRVFFTGARLDRWE